MGFEGHKQKLYIKKNEKTQIFQTTKTENQLKIFTVCV